MRRLGSFVEQPTPPAQLELFELRRCLSSTLIGHLKTEDWILYPRLLGSSDEQVALTGRRFNEEMGGLAAAFAQYSERWSATAIDSDWAGYCRESRAIIEALTNRITCENRELLPCSIDSTRRPNLPARVKLSGAVRRIRNGNLSIDRSICAMCRGYSHTNQPFSRP